MSELRPGQLRRWNEDAYKEYVPELIRCEYFTLIDKNDDGIWRFYEGGIIDMEQERILLTISDEVEDE